MPRRDNAAMHPLAIVSAMPEELAALLPLVEQRRVQRLAGRELHHGQLQGREVVLTLSGIGKVAAAATTSLLVDRRGAGALLFSGVAGGLGVGVRVGDVVVGTQLLQHDLDASPIFPRWQVPGTGRSHFDADAAMAEALAAAVREVYGEPPHRGLIVSGDRFVSSAAESRQLQADLPHALAVDMESAAVAQVCADFGCPLAVLRTISDRADDQAHLDFPKFLAEVAAPLARRIVLAALPRL